MRFIRVLVLSAIAVGPQTAVAATRLAGVVIDASGAPVPAATVTVSAGGDEINIIQPRRNYGWPLISLGREYNRTATSRDVATATSFPVSVI